MPKLKRISLILGLLSVCSAAQAESVYTCANGRGDTVMIRFENGGHRMALRSLYAGLTLTKASYAVAKGYSLFQGSIPGSEETATASVSTTLASGKAKNEGLMTFEGDDYSCRAGAGKLKISKATREEFGLSPMAEPCKLTSYFDGMQIIPPKVVCDYGNGFHVMFAR